MLLTTIPVKKAAKYVRTASAWLLKVECFREDLELPAVVRLVGKTRDASRLQVEMNVRQAMG
jgi:hypothetical protein